MGSKAPQAEKYRGEEQTGGHSDSKDNSNGRIPTRNDLVPIISLSILIVGDDFNEEEALRDEPVQNG
jgi:hypothetical protein